jgi:flagellar protein FlbD
VIELTKINGSPIYINPHLIESMERGVETRILFISGKTILVKENKDEIISRIVRYRRQLGINAQEI